MNIILEGCDCVGKSSIAKELVKMAQYKIKKCRAPKTKNGAMKEYKDKINELNKSDCIIYDRFMLSECVYAPIFRNYHPEYARSFEQKLSNNTYLFLIHADENIVKKRFDNKFIKPEQIKTILKTFKKEFIFSEYPRKYLIDTTKLTSKEAAVKILRIMTEDVLQTVGMELSEGLANGN